MANGASFAMDEKKLHHLSKNKKNGWAPSSYTQHRRGRREATPSNGYMTRRKNKKGKQWFTLALTRPSARRSFGQACRYP